MENDQIQNDINLETKYNPLKDGSFWAALIIGLIPIILSFVGLITDYKIIMNEVHWYGYGYLLKHGIVSFSLLFVWESWIILNKGKNYSLVVGFLIALFIFFFLGFNLILLPSIR